MASFTKHNSTRLNMTSVCLQKLSFINCTAFTCLRVYIYIYMCVRARARARGSRYDRDLAIERGLAMCHRIMHGCESSGVKSCVVEPFCFHKRRPSIYFFAETWVSFSLFHSFVWFHIFTLFWWYGPDFVNHGNYNRYPTPSVRSLPSHPHPHPSGTTVHSHAHPELSKMTFSLLFLSIHFTNIPSLYRRDPAGDGEGVKVGGAELDSRTQPFVLGIVC